MATGKPLPKELIQKMREEVLKGKTKYRVAKEMRLNEFVVYSHTSDLPCVNLGEPFIRGKTFDLLKQLLDVGYVSSTKENYQSLQRIKRFLPMIQHTRIDYQRVYYLSDRNKIALQAMISQKKTRILSYQELKSFTKMFGVDLSCDEKHKIVRLPERNILPAIRKKNGGFLSSLKRNQMSLDDFDGENGFLGRNGQRNHRKNQGFKIGSLLENGDSLVDFCTRMYWKYSKERKEKIRTHLFFTSTATNRGCCSRHAPQAPLRSRKTQPRVSPQAAGTSDRRPRQHAVRSIRCNASPPWDEGLSRLLFSRHLLSFRSRGHASRSQHPASFL
jgi:hypothetical protein